MRSKGNGAPTVCVNNLLQLIRGEVPFERVKGMDPNMVDSPVMDSTPEIRQDAEWLIDTYEPRASVVDISITQDVGVNGGFIVTAEIREKEE